MEGGPQGPRIEMTKEEKIVNFLFHNPQSTITVVADVADVGHSQATYILCKLAKQGLVMRERRNRVSHYSTVPGFEPAVEEVAKQVDPRIEEITKIEARIADLERRKLWRRAMTELANLMTLQGSSVGVGVIAQRRNQCSRNIKLMKSSLAGGF